MVMQRTIVSESHDAHCGGGLYLPDAELRSRRASVHVTLVGAPGEAVVIVTDHADRMLRTLGSDSTPVRRAS